MFLNKGKGWGYQHLFSMNMLLDPAAFKNGNVVFQMATIRRHSLQLASAATHPGGSGGGRINGLPYGRFLRVTYTAGSMAGLGFSMAILGLGIGIFLGFLLWKRRIGLPYYLAP